MCLGKQANSCNIAKIFFTMNKITFLIVCFLSITFFQAIAQEEAQSEEQESIKRNKIAVVFGDALIHEVRNTTTGKEQFVMAPTFGLDYTYALSHHWSIGTYNEISFLNIEVEDGQDQYVKRENTLLFSLGAGYEITKRFGVFAGAGIETDPNETLMILYTGAEYTIIRSNDWDVALAAGYITKELYDSFTFGVVIGRRFGKNIPSKHHE